MAIVHGAGAVQEDGIFGEEEKTLKKAYDEFRHRDPIFLAALMAAPECVCKTLSDIRNCPVYDRSEKEYRYYRRLFSRLLKFEDCVYFTHIWDRTGELQLVNMLPL